MNKNFNNNCGVNDLLMQNYLPFCLNQCQTSPGGLVPSCNIKYDNILENDAMKSSHDSTSQGSYCNQRYVIKLLA